MKKLVVDASVAIKWFVPEIHSPAASRLLDATVHLCAPDLIGPEIGNTLWKKVRRDSISRQEASEILTTFESIGVEIYASAVLLAGAFEIAAALDRTVYDSIYLALAMAQDCALVTADRKFYSSVSASALANHIQWIEDEL